MDFKELVTSKINSIDENIILGLSDFRGDIAVLIDAKDILKTAELLKSDKELNFEMCTDITAVDSAHRKKRFTVVYNLYSLALNKRLRVKAEISSDVPEIDSVTQLWQSANWYERETWDMYGIKFINHPDLRRIYMPEEFKYHPLRKEFPVLGIPGSLPLPEQVD